MKIYSQWQYWTSELKSSGVWLSLDGWVIPNISVVVCLSTKVKETRLFDRRTWDVRQQNYHHHRLYSLGKALASSSKSWAAASQFLQPSLLVSYSSQSIHLDFSQPHPRWLPGFVHNILTGNLFSSIRTTWPALLSLLDFITLIIFGSL